MHDSHLLRMPQVTRDPIIILEHHLHSKTFVVETRLAGERPLYRPLSSPWF